MKRLLAVGLLGIFLVTSAPAYAASGEYHRGAGFGDVHGFVPGISLAQAGYPWGWGWGGWGWNDPWFYGPRVVEVKPINYGIIKFDVKPETSRVYIDEKYVGTVNDLHDEKVKLPGGYHDVKVVSPTGRTVQRNMFVALGERAKFKAYFLSGS